jgi:hypothetical protein
MRDAECGVATRTHLYPNLELPPQQPAAPNLYNTSMTSDASNPALTNSPAQHASTI